MSTTAFVFMLVGVAYAASRLFAIVDWIEKQNKKPPRHRAVFVFHNNDTVSTQSDPSKP